MMAVVTVRFAVPDADPRVAIIAVFPAPTPVATPFVPGESLIVATPGANELQCAEFVTSCVLASVNVPWAVNAWSNPRGIPSFPGLTTIETTAAGVTVRRVVPLIPPSVAVTRDVPPETDVPRPAGLTVATAVLAELQLTEAVRSCWLPSLNVPIASNC